MRIVISVSYSDIFEGDTPNVKDLLTDIPSEVVISILSLINSQLYLGHDLKTQLKIFKFLTFRQNEELKSRILSKLLMKSEKDPSIQFFGLLYSTEFIHFELLNYRDFHITDTTPQQELNFLKAYFLIVEEVNSKYATAFKVHKPLDSTHFQKTTWPTFFDQFEINHGINPITSMVKGLTLLNFLEFHSPFAKHVKIFLQENQKETTWNYILDLANLIKSGWDTQRQDPGKLYPFSFKKSDGYKSLFESFSISVEAYKKEYGSFKKNFSGLKDKPLFKIKEQDYIVLNWNFLANKLYDGLVFDFFHRSGIRNDGGFDSFLEFKRFVSKEITEKFLFRKLIEKCFKKNHLTLMFDDGRNKGFPDAYVRDGKHLFLIEIKDAFFPAHAVNSLSYESIKSTIDQKYNSDKKGTSQIVRQIEKLSKSSFEQKTFEQLKLKRRNLRVYPIMVYTDFFFNLPGVNQYLRNELRNKVKAKHLYNSFGKIEDLTFIHLSFLVDNVHLLSNPQFRLKKLIDEYHRRINTMEKIFEKQKSMETLFSINDPFESFATAKYNDEIRSSKEYIETIVEVLNLTENLS